MAELLSWEFLLYLAPVSLIVKIKEGARYILLQLKSAFLIKMCYWKTKPFLSITEIVLFTCLYEIRNVQFHWRVFKVLVAAGRQKSTIVLNSSVFLRYPLVVTFDLLRIVKGFLFGIGVYILVLQSLMSFEGCRPMYTLLCLTEWSKTHWVFNSEKLKFIFQKHLGKAVLAHK